MTGWLEHAETGLCALCGKHHAPSDYQSWAESVGAVLVYEDPSGEEPLNVYAVGDVAKDDVVVLHQGGDEIAIPSEEIGHFTDALEALNTGRRPLSEVAP